MAKTINLNERLPVGTYVYVGRRQLRHESEPNLKQEEMIETVPEAYPHTFIDFSGAKLADVLEHAGGKQGCVVDTQKVVRDKSTLAEVQAWRAAFTGETLEKVLDSVELDEATYTSLASLGESYVVIKFATAGSKLDVPKQPKDMLREIKENATIIYEAMLANLDESEQLEKVEAIYTQLVSMK